MKYIDLHCDALTTTAARQVTKENLTGGGCFLQCFAAFVYGRENAYERTVKLIDAFYAMCEKEGYRPVTNACSMGEGVNAMLTVEGGEAIEGSLEKLAYLSRRGVKMLTLVWNFPNEIGAPAFPDYFALKEGKILLTEREKTGGLTKFGHSCVEKMNELNMIVDVSHASDLLVKDVASCSKRPFVASHSNANSVHSCARNLTDEGIRLVANSGGVVGLNFCADFLSGDMSEEGQRAAMVAHARAIVNAGGEDCLAIGSDFDGAPPNPFLKTPCDMPKLLALFAKEFGEDRAEKFAFRNARRVLFEA